MQYKLSDFNGADDYYGSAGAEEWSDIAAILDRMPIFLHPSDQKGKIGMPIFDPKATNAHLNAQARQLGWRNVAVPTALRAFGVDWDAGKRGTLAEWQFSNYPFLWNNVIRTEAVIKGQVNLEDVGITRALIVVTKSGTFPSSNSTLYYEQAEAQLRVVTELDVFSTPIRLVGVAMPDGAQKIDVVWSRYGARYGREAQSSTPMSIHVRWGQSTSYGGRRAMFDRPL